MVLYEIYIMLFKWQVEADLR